MTELNRCDVANHRQLKLKAFENSLQQQNFRALWRLIGHQQESAIVIQRLCARLKSGQTLWMDQFPLLNVHRGQIV
ncbi:Uncharacterised protein [Vibrio cholerae]|nr:Uncharacterised protein [Vibrio cholerae]